MQIEVFAEPPVTKWLCSCPLSRITKSALSNCFIKLHETATQFGTKLRQKQLGPQLPGQNIYPELCLRVTKTKGLFCTCLGRRCSVIFSFWRTCVSLQVATILFLAECNRYSLYVIPFRNFWETQFYAVKLWNFVKLKNDGCSLRMVSSFIAFQ